MLAEPGVNRAVIASIGAPGQLAVAFRGALSFWTAGEIGDAALGGRARAAVMVSLLGFVPAERRRALLAGLEAP